VQLLTIRNEYDTFGIRERYWNDWSATAYILTRDYAKKIIDTYIKGDTYHLEIPNQEVMPLIENIIFASVGKTYTIPLFAENTEFNSTFENQDDDVNSGQKSNHRIARDLVLNYWKGKETKVEIEKTELEKLLYDYSLDTENPEHNFNLGIWYENEGHTAPALSYYLRCAERSYETNPDLAYEALIRGSYCYEKQGTRDGSARSMLWQAQAFRTDRPEAYYLLSRFAEKREWWQDCYMNADLALKCCNFDCSPLRTDIGYPGKYGLLFEKAISGWWWGKSDECKSLLQEILENYELSEQDYLIISNNAKKIGMEISQNKKNVEFSYSNNFDWSDLSYEDIITIEREVVHEKVYRFWKDVKENDVVLDIGASVGAYAISILDQKPQKIYCVEPSKKLLSALSKNCSNNDALVCINHGIVDNPDDKINIFGGEEEFTGITFKELVEKYSIDHINFMKVDCEGGEYNIFKDENINFLKNNVDFIAMEVHLNYSGCREKFKNFRDNYLTQFKDYKVMSCTRQNISWGNSIDIKNNIFDDNFIDNYTCEFMIYIKND
jgi:FkbM family methyltransferase